MRNIDKYIGSIGAVGNERMCIFPETAHTCVGCPLKRDKVNCVDSGAVLDWLLSETRDIYILNKLEHAFLLKAEKNYDLVGVFRGKVFLQKNHKTDRISIDMFRMLKPDIFIMIKGILDNCKVI